MVTAVGVFVLFTLVIGAAIITVQQVRGLTQRVNKLETELNKSLAELANVLLARMEALEHVIDFHYPDELENERRKIRSE